MLPLLIALQFLTSLPIRLPAMPTPRQQGRSLLHYPAVGLFLGALLWLAALLLEGASPLLQAALLLALWVALTGALHLDGLADSADAWLGGFGDPARTLEIMKDPRSGPVAVVVLVLLLLLKFSALLVVLQAQQPERGHPAQPDAEFDTALFGPEHHPADQRGEQQQQGGSARTAIQQPRVLGSLLDRRSLVSDMLR